MQKKEIELASLRSECEQKEVALSKSKSEVEKADAAVQRLQQDADKLKSENQRLTASNSQDVHQLKLYMEEAAQLKKEVERVQYDAEASSKQSSTQV